MADTKHGHSDQAYNPAFNLSDPAFDKGLQNIGHSWPNQANGEMSGAAKSYPDGRGKGANVDKSATQAQTQKRFPTSNDPGSFKNTAAPGRGKGK